MTHVTTYIQNSVMWLIWLCVDFFIMDFQENFQPGIHKNWEQKLIWENITTQIQEQYF